MGWAFVRSLLRLNRTSVGLKERQFSHIPSAQPKPQSNQRGIESTME